MRDLIRQVVSSYHGLKLEGQGQGYVQFRAEEPDSRQPVIIKVLPRVMGKDSQIAARFRALSQLIRQLNHPNIVPVRDVGEKAGLPYMVVRALEKAQPLADRLNQPWAVDAAADLTMQVGQALEHAYNKGLVHGGLSPDEVLVQEDGRALVNDFGLVQLMDLGGIKAQAKATPYISPERAAGRPPDPRGDVYSLAAILYTLLTRRPPQIVQDQVLPPSRFNGEVPKSMDAVVVKALAPNPDERYPTVKEFVAALGAVTLLPALAKAAPAVPGAQAAPAGGQATPAAQGVRCPHCGAENQAGRFCRRCGTRLQADPPKAQPPVQTRAAKPQAARPQAAQSRVAALTTKPVKAQGKIQITTIDVGKVEMGKGLETEAINIVTPLTVATGELATLFPEPVAMPAVDTSSLSMALGDASMPAMPEPPPIPQIKWADLVPPLSEVPTVETTQPEQAGE